MASFFSGLSSLVPQDDNTWSERYRHKQAFDQLTDAIKEKRNLKEDEYKENREIARAYDQSFQETSVIIKAVTETALSELSNSKLSKNDAETIAEKHKSRLERYKKEDERFKNPDFILQVDLAKTLIDKQNRSFADRKDYSSVMQSLQTLYKDNLEKGDYSLKDYGASDDIIQNAKNLQDGAIHSGDEQKVKALDLIMKKASQREYVMRILKNYDANSNAETGAWVQFKKEDKVGKAEKDMVRAAEDHLKAGDIDSAWAIVTGGQAAKKEDRKTLNAFLKLEIEANAAGFRGDADRNIKILSEYQKDISDLDIFRDTDMANTVNQPTEKGIFNQFAYDKALKRDVNAMREAVMETDIGDEMKSLDDEGKNYFMFGYLRKIDRQFVWNVGLEDGTAIVPYTDKDGEPLEFHKYGDLTGTINRERVDESRKELAERLGAKKTIHRKGAKEEDVQDVSDITNLQFIKYMGALGEAWLNSPGNADEMMRFARMEKVMTNPSFRKDIANLTEKSRLDEGAESLAKSLKESEVADYGEAISKFFEEYKGDFTEKNRDDILKMAVTLISQGK